jgi:hypothetical protein
MRFISVDEQDVSLTVLESALKQTEAAYLIERDEESDSEGVLVYEGDVYGQIEVNRRGDETFGEEVEELREFVEGAEGAKKPEVLGVLSGARTLIAVRVLDHGRELEAMLEKIDPLWEWLLTNRKGLLQADGEGYYDASGLILEVE